MLFQMQIQIQIQIQTKTISNKSTNTNNKTITNTSRNTNTIQIQIQMSGLKHSVCIAVHFSHCHHTVGMVSIEIDSLSVLYNTGLQ